MAESCDEHLGAVGADRCRVRVVDELAGPLQRSVQTTAPVPALYSTVAYSKFEPSELWVVPTLDPVTNTFEPSGLIVKAPVRRASSPSNARRAITADPR